MSASNSRNNEAQLWENLVDWLTTQCPVEIAEMILEATFEEYSATFQLTNELWLRRHGDVGWTRPSMETTYMRMRKADPGASDRLMQVLALFVSFKFPARPSMPLWGAKRAIRGESIGDLVASLYKRRVNSYEAAIKNAIEGTTIKPIPEVVDVISAPGSRVELNCHAVAAMEFLALLPTQVSSRIRTLVIGMNIVYPLSLKTRYMFRPEDDQSSLKVCRFTRLMMHACTGLREVILWMLSSDAETHDPGVYYGRVAEDLCDLLEAGKLNTVRFSIDGLEVQNVWDRPLLRKLVSREEYHFEEFSDPYKGNLDHLERAWEKEMMRLQALGPRFVVETEQLRSHNMSCLHNSNEPDHTVITFRRGGEDHKRVHC